MIQNNISIVLTREGGWFKRRFDDLDETNLNMLILQHLATQDGFTARLSKVLEQIHGIPSQALETVLRIGIFQKIGETFMKEEAVTWYLNELGFKVLKDAANTSIRIEEYSITIKACVQHLFYALRCKEKDKEEFLLAMHPFFRKAPPPVDSNDTQNVRGLADTIFFLAPHLEDILKLGDVALLDFLKWFNITLNISRIEVLDANSFKIRCTPKVDYPLPTTEKKCISISKGRSVLVSSPNFRDAIEKLQEVWQAPIPTVLCGWTGSGKDELANLLMDAMQVEKEYQLKCSAASLETFKRFTDEVGPWLDKIEQLRVASLLGAGTPKVIFLDEIHHNNAKNIRSGILRPLSSGRLSIGKRKTVSLKDILLLFAASTPFDKLRTREPSDLWNRVRPVQLKHPLLLNYSEVRREVMEDYFRLFWYLAVKKRQNDSAELNSIQYLLAMLEEEPYVEELTNTFVRELDVPPIFCCYISMRSVRSIAERLLAKAIEYGRFQYAGRAEEEMKRDMRWQVQTWTKEMSSEISREVNPLDVF